ncbi:SDR family NAD(P)-dependent oxidoreductase [Rhodococcus sp. KRD162]|uniref:SDR family NAD(P)-dependent oxidoreductase n=1 Tax=Rhodococcus sp. KRD162 TaxID=2729725 RepID=UPI001F49D7EE|nr:SDR family NAD(P)-dependent oxidoreductase [Rhodococcus sp. KRD162]
MTIVERWRSTDPRHRRKPWDRCRGVAAAGAAATLGSPGMYVHYAAAKAAVDTLPVGLSKEVAAQEVAAQSIRGNAVEPGIIETDFHRNRHQGGGGM